jgi:4-hydroxy-tetrahydrodipicolinate synthase
MSDVRATPLYTAIVTPFFPEGEVNYTELEQLLRIQEKASNGIVVLGSTGEGLALTEGEKRKVVKFSADLGLKVPLLVGVGGFQLPETLEFLKFSDALPIDGFLMPVPLYAKPGLEGQVEWFTALLDAVNKPCMLYNVPSRTGVKLYPEALKRVSIHKNAWAVKEASGSVAAFQEYRKAAPNLSFYSGDDALTPDFAKEGAVGLVSVASNVWPEETNRFVRLALTGKTDDCIDMWRAASESLFSASNPVPVKALLQTQGKISSGKVRAPLSERDLKSVAPLERWNNEIRAWHRSM